MTLIKVIEPNRSPNCPLCDKPMRVIVDRRGRFYACLEDECMISINSRDPACGRWREKEDTAAPKCYICGEPMRMFFRAADKYLKVQCRGKGSKRHRLVQVQRGKVEFMPPHQGGRDDKGNRSRI